MNISSQELFITPMRPMSAFSSHVSGISVSLLALEWLGIDSFGSDAISSNLVTQLNHTGQEFLWAFFWQGLIRVSIKKLYAQSFWRKSTSTASFFSLILIIFVLLRPVAGSIHIYFIYPQYMLQTFTSMVSVVILMLIWVPQNHYCLFYLQI